MPDQEPAPNADATDPASLSRPRVYLLVTVLLLLSNVPVAILIWLWPDRADLEAPQRISLFAWSLTLSPEQRILLCVAFCGLLGGSIRLLLRIRNDFTSPQITPRYIPWYFLTPPMGAILAMGFYLVVRGGFLGSGASAENVNLFAFGGTGVLVGLFAEVATARMEAAFSGAFASRDDHVEPRRPQGEGPGGVAS